MTTIHPPDDRLDGPVHTWFGLSYSNYQVLPRTLMQSMPVQWQQRMVQCLEELDAAFAHVEQAGCYKVTPAREREFCELSEAEMRWLGVTTDDEEEGRFYDADGSEREPHDRLLVPFSPDPVPHYNRGRTYVAPRIEGEPA